MREIAFFVEDFAHREFLEALVQRLAEEYGVEIRTKWRNARRGHGAVVGELKQFLRDLQQGHEELPDLVIVGTDANCKGLVERLRQINDVVDKIGMRIVSAVPDPHIERWLLVDSSAFKNVFGKGCNAPDQKCERDRYKKILIDAIRQSGIVPSIGGIEFAGDIVRAMNLDHAVRADGSLRRLVEELRQVFNDWRRV